MPNLLTFTGLSRSLFFLSIGLLISCVPTPKANIFGMKTPEIIKIQNTKKDNTTSKLSSTKHILFATDRLPSRNADYPTRYSSEQSTFVRIGQAQVNHLHQSSGAKKKPITLSNVKEIGVLKSTNIYGELASLDDDTSSVIADDKFIKLLNAKLKKTKSKDVVIFINGYRTLFENPLLVSAEFSEYLDDHGVVMAYSWATKTKR